MIRLVKRPLLCLALCLASPAFADTPERGMVVSANKLATAAGIEMLNKGGNAFDAAAAVTLALGVVEPASCGIGGGGFFLLYIAKTQRYVMIDARESSPKLAGHGEVYRKVSSMDGPASAGVPGVPAGVEHLVQRYGRLSLAENTAPSALLAEKGFATSPRLAGMIRFRRDAFNDTARLTFDKQEGEIIRQPVLAETLSHFAKEGSAAFYRGQIAGRLVADIKQHGGLIRESDMAAYRAKERLPVQFDYQGYRITSAALPSSGGMTLAMIFGMLADDRLQAMNRIDRIHLLTEAMRRAYRDRNRRLGDSDFIEVPADYLDAARLIRLREGIDMSQATPSQQLQGLPEPSGDGMDTAHFSIIDGEGNMVSATLSLNYPFGSGYLSPATGILLNDEMNDFAIEPGKPNAFGLVQGRANAVAPGKRMLSSMSPTIITGPERTLIVGTPGGSRIITAVMQAAIDFMHSEGGPDQWTAAPRYHHQFLPDILYHEQGAFTADEQTELIRRGHRLKQVRNYGNMQAIVWNRKSGEIIGSADPRGEGISMMQRESR